MQSKWLSRKFVLTVLFAAIVVGNAWFVSNTPLAWEEVLAVGAVFGVYQGANALVSGKYNEACDEEVE